MNSVISAHNLSKTYYVRKRKPGLKGAVFSLFRNNKQAINAVNNIDIHIEEGELVGFIGPNGAGKSTTIKMLSGIIMPTDGDVLVCGNNPNKDRINNSYNIGAVFGQKTQLWWDLPVRESFELLRRMYGIDDKAYKDNLQEFVECLGVSEFISQPVRQLSLGQRIRAEIIAALIHNPKVVYLDEPTIGLDIDAKIKIREFIKKINNERNITFLLTTHDLQDIEELAKRIIVINHGKICFDGTMYDFQKAYIGDGMRKIICTLNDSTAVTLSPDFSNCLIKQEGRKLVVNYSKHINERDLILELMNYSPDNIEIRGPTIEDLVMEVYKV